MISWIEKGSLVGGWCRNLVECVCVANGVEVFCLLEFVLCIIVISLLVMDQLFHL